MKIKYLINDWIGWLIFITIWICGFCVGYNLDAAKATYYHPDLIGESMANRQPFDTLAYTCASYDYPLGTLLCVTNIENNRSVFVIIADRHDYRTDIDLSFIAYTELRDFDWNDNGKINVTIKEIK